MNSLILKGSLLAGLLATLTCAGPAVAATGTGIYAATVGSSGLLIRGTRATSSTKSATGTYSVVFPDVISQCSWTATVGGTGTTPPGTPGFAVSHRSSSSTSTIEVRTWVVNSQAVHVKADAPFHLIVVCD